MTPGTPLNANVLVDFDGNSVMDTEHAWLRVVITDLELVSPQTQCSLLTISDGTGKRYSVGTSGGNYSGGLMASPVSHVTLATPIVLPVGSPLQVTVQTLTGVGPLEVNLIGRIVNL